MSSESILVLSTFPDAESARRAAPILVEEKLAACANILLKMESVYRWKGKIEVATEVLVLLKSTSDKYKELEARIRELHPYEVPEIISIRIESGQSDYLNWIEESVVH